MKQETETWKPITGYEGKYEISSFGRVKSLARTYTGTVGLTMQPCVKPLRERILRPTLIKTIGYLMVQLCADGKPKHFTIHRLVAAAFVPNPLGLPEVNHLDSCRTNNRPFNLEWTTRAGNLRHAGPRMARPKLTARQVRQIRRRAAAGADKYTLAARYGVTPSNIVYIVRRKTWQNV